MKRVFFVTGCVASGKSSFMQIAKNSGFECISADEIAHQILALNSAKIAEILQNSSFLEGGKINRKKLGKLVFNDNALRKKLENFMHPKIRFNIMEKINKAQGVIFVELPLFFETKNYENLGEVIVIYAPKELCLKRLMQRNSLNKNEALKRLNAQIDIEKKRKLADIIIENSSSQGEFETKCKEFLLNLRGENQS